MAIIADTTAPGHTSGSVAGPANPIRLLLVDDKLIVRAGVRALLDQQSGFHVVAEAAGVTDALALDVRPDVVVTDLVLPDARELDVVVGLRRRFARAAILVLTDLEQSDRLHQIISAGADGYVRKTATAPEFLSGIRAVAQGVPYVEPSRRPQIVPTSPWHGAPSPTSEAAAVNSLSTAEREVLRLLVLGHTNAEIAALGAVSLRTVEARRARLVQKLGVRTRADLVRIANRVGGLHPGLS